MIAMTAVNSKTVNPRTAHRARNHAVLLALLAFARVIVIRA
jgi:hypothetical protein